MQLEPGENPDYSFGIHDNTHFNTYGARQIAELVLQRIKNRNPDLQKRIIENKKKNQS